MTNNIDIDLASIPHPKDCYPVPVGATIPAGTPYWSLFGRARIAWYQRGLKTEIIVDGRDGATFMTIAPIAAPLTPPTPDDSPIIITRTNRDEVRDGLLAVWAPRDQEWRFTGRDGYTHWISSEAITEWSPVIVTKSGHGIWDERDKRDRVDADGDTWRWSDAEAVWASWDIDYNRTFGSLAAMKRVYGEGYLTGFADEDDAPCE